ncbi:MAG: response regulator transcription factor [Caldilineaceae bacterium]|nr:response regulator transcription factor [Caldilineaceae bacterium]
MVTPHAESILVIDDDPHICEMVTIKLEQAGYKVFSAGSVEHAMDLIRKFGLPHLAIVDIHMPERSGLDFCEEILAYSDLPIMMLTADDDLSTIIESIERYAEDYIVKPFNLNELLVRVRRVLRRVVDTDYAMAPQQRIDSGLTVNIAAQTIYVDDAEKKLTPTESKLLHILLQHRNTVVRTDYLLKRIWPNEEIFEDTLRVHIHRLRQKLNTSEQKHPYIVTERGVGYRFIG